MQDVSQTNRVYIKELALQLKGGIDGSQKAMKITEGELSAAAGHSKVLDLFRLLWPGATLLVGTCCEHPPCLLLLLFGSRKLGL